MGWSLLPIKLLTRLCVLTSAVHSGFPTPDGHAATNFTSIPKLAAGTISTITSLDGKSTFTLSTLNAALREALLFANPSVVRTLDFSGSAASTLDHPDHLASAILMRDVVLASLPSAQLVGWVDFRVAEFRISLILCSL